MGCEIARRLFPLTSATGAATVSQPQCRDVPQWVDLNSIFKKTFKDKEALRKDFKSNSPVCDAKCCRIWTVSSLMTFLSEKGGACYEKI